MCFSLQCDYQMSNQCHYFKICIDKLWFCSISNNLSACCLQLASWRITFGTSHPCGMRLKNAVSTFYLPSSTLVRHRDLGNHLRISSGCTWHVGITWLPRATVPSHGHCVTSWASCPNQPEMHLPFVTAGPWAPRARHPLTHDLLWWQGTSEMSLSGALVVFFTPVFWGRERWMNELLSLFFLPQLWTCGLSFSNAAEGMS